MTLVERCITGSTSSVGSSGLADCLANLGEGGRGETGREKGGEGRGMSEGGVSDP